MPINGMRNSALIIILGLTFVLITLTNYIDVNKIFTIYY